MKIARQIVLVAGLAFFAATSFAALKLKQPAGLAVDAAGNLYVANFNLNNILVYSPKYVQLFNKTIKQNVFGPQAVAIDPYGNVWVANFRGNENGTKGYITEYTGVTQIAASTINTEIAGPIQLAFDGLDDLWVLNDGAYISVYSPTTAFAPPSNLLKTVNTADNSTLTAFTLSPGVLVSGTGTETSVDSSSVLLQGQAIIGSAGAGFDVSAAAMAPDSSGNTYISDTNGNVNILTPNFVLTGPIFTLGFRPRGMAVDNKNKRLYASNETTNEIVVYSIVTGELLATIGNAQ